MAFLIDGYNLLHASGILARGVGPGSLERSRTALLNFLAESLEEKQLATTIVVFDARGAPPGLPRVIVHRGITVRFAPRGTDADTEIERIVEEHNAPKRLTIVSSDHRLHRAARRRRAKAVDSDKWYADVVRQRIDRARSKVSTGKPPAPATEAEVRFWLRQFGLEVPEEPAAEATPLTDLSAEMPTGDEEKPSPPLSNPFPPDTPKISARKTFERLGKRLATDQHAFERGGWPSAL